ncbi:hypothetical protein [Bacteroides acidifaciens]|uniref:hypothetical protein n=1 Tax=Bacteroides acidifaciens TaxID=85831 RepID=UPI00263BBFA8|nr:hypothetical protein [Bacteroides acidifaciens]
MTKANKRHELLTATCTMEKIMRPIIITTMLLQFITGKKIFAFANIGFGSIALGWAIGSTASMLKLNK